VQLTRVETSRTFPPNSDAPREARAFVAQTLNQVGATERADDIRWVVSELATDAVLHAHTPFTVSVEVFDREVDIAVCEQSPSAAEPGQPTGEDETGRGLFLVSTLADKWSSEKLPTGKRVWVQLRRTRT
jgi:anti-sigma regulatory factor (Ser/Thr protein kinase)